MTVPGTTRQPGDERAIVAPPSRIRDHSAEPHAASPDDAARLLLRLLTALDATKPGDRPVPGPQELLRAALLLVRQMTDSGTPPPVSAPEGGAPLSADLTPRERTVAHLAVRGLTNREIAEELFLSTKTVEFHLTNVYNKLHVRSRWELRRLFGG